MISDWFRTTKLFAFYIQRTCLRLVYLAKLAFECLLKHPGNCNVKIKHDFVPCFFVFYATSRKTFLSSSWKNYRPQQSCVVLLTCRTKHFVSSACLKCHRSPWLTSCEVL